MDDFDMLMGKIMLGAIEPTENQWAVMGTLMFLGSEDEPLDIITVAERLEDAGALELVGGLEHISSLAAKA